MSGRRETRLSVRMGGERHDKHQEKGGQGQASGARKADEAKSQEGRETKLSAGKVREIRLNVRKKEGRQG